jgi:hypothetical protein
MLALLKHKRNRTVRFNIEGSEYDVYISHNSNGKEYTLCNRFSIIRNSYEWSIFKKPMSPSECYTSIRNKNIKLLLN